MADGVDRDLPYSARRFSIPYRAQVVLLALAAVALFVGSDLLRTPNRPEAKFGELIGAVALVIVVGRLFGEVVARFGQPRVMGEVLGGILLGPSLVGSLPVLFPQLGLPAEPGASWPFSRETVGGLTAGAEIGLVFYMFLVGLELDPAVVRARAKQAVAISLTSIALPFALGTGTGLVLLSVAPALGDAQRPVAFTIFMGVAMSITAFPVLARILIERRMIRGPIGALALACAAIDDVIAWALLAVATASAVAGGAMLAGGASGATQAPVTAAPDPIAIMVLALVFCAVMALIARPVLARVAEVYDEAGHVPGAWIVVLFVGILMAAFFSQRVGIAAIFGAFVVGLIMPRRSGLTHDITRRLEDFVVIVLLPLFFVVSGLRTDIGAQIAQPSLWAWTLVLIAIAIGGKWIGATVAARATGIDGRGALAIGALMNTRGLTELIVLNVGLTLGVISRDLFTMLVIMALVTTFMAGPALRLIDRKGRLAVTVEEEVEHATGIGPRAVRAILVACQDAKNLDSLIALARPLAVGGGARDLILVRLVEPSPLTTRYAPEQREISAATDELRRRAEALTADGITARSVALLAANSSDDLVRLARDERIDLVVTDGRRSLTVEGVPGGPVGALLQKAECDVAVLVERGDTLTVDADHAVIVPFGGSANDWAAVEVGAWIADANGARVRLLAPGGGERDETGAMLASAALAVQGVSGVAVEPVLIEPGQAAVLAAARDAGLLIVGLSGRWREEGLGPLRRAIALEALVPTLFVRRGVRAGVLGAGESDTFMRWSAVDIGARPDAAQQTK